MAWGFNKVFLLGRLGADPDIRFTANGTCVANFPLATNRRFKRNDQWEEATDWHNVVAWGRLADVVNQYLRKGNLIFIEGELRTRSWIDKNNNKRSTIEVHTQNLQMLDSRGEKEYSAVQDWHVEADNITPPSFEDDVPF